MCNKMSSTAKLSKKMRKKISVLKGYSVEVSENSFILFENEQDYLNLFYLEKVVFDLINNILYNKDIDKEIRIYFGLTLINEYLKSLPKYRKIIIICDASCENSFEKNFPFICCFEDCEKRGEYLKEIEFLGRENVDCVCDYDCECDDRGDCNCDCDDCDYCFNCVCDDCDNCDCDCDCDVCDCYKLCYEGESLIFKYRELIKLLHKRIDIEYYKIKKLKKK